MNKPMLIALSLLFSASAQALTVQVVNNTGSTITYSGESITINANSTVTVPNGVLLPFAQDPAVASDLAAGNTSLNDTVTVYGGGAALAFLSNAATLQSALDKSGSGTITALNGTVVAITNGASSIAFTVTNIGTATLTIEATNDTTNWIQWQMINPAGTLKPNTSSNNTFVAPCGGFQQIRLRATAYTSGTVNVTWNSGLGSNISQIYSLNASNVLIASWLNDGSGNAITSTKDGAVQKLDVNTGTKSSGTPTQTSVSCATSSTTLLAASTANKFLSIRNPTTATATVWINVAGSAATAAVPSLDLAPGAEADYFASENSFLPTAQINCISGGGSASSLTLIYK